MKINQNSLDIFCAEKINKLEEASGFRTLKTTHRASGAQSQQAGKSLISFSCNDYLGLSHHPVILEKAHEAAKLSMAQALPHHGLSPVITRYWSHWKKSWQN